jgi:glucose-6-phosphate 1-epimerase
MTDLQPGHNGLPKLILTTASGSRAEVYTHGAHLTAWIPSDGRERIFLSNTSLFQEGSAIRGGTPICFPQFSSLGPLPKHGFARTLPWEIVPQTADTVAVLRLRDSEKTRALWPHAFEAQFTVTLTDESLSLALTVTNPGPASFDFTAALHTYFRVTDIAAAQVEGLEGQAYVDQVTGVSNLQPNAPITFNGEVDRAYYQTPSTLTLRDGDKSSKISAQGFTDTVVWNPSLAKGQSLTDLEPDGHRRFVCVEAAAIGQPVHLEPKQTWGGTQILHL